MKYPLVIGFTLLSLHIAQAELFTGTTKLSNKTFEDIVVLGEADLTNIKTNSITIGGSLVFNHVDASDVNIAGSVKEGSSYLICKDLNVGGSIIAKNIKCANINVFGAAKLENIDVSDNISIAGRLELKKAKLKNLDAATSEIYLEDVTANDITIDTIPLSSDTQKLYLKGSSIISGSIKFESGKGIVIIGDKVTTGKITGGILKKDAPTLPKK